MRYNYTWDWLDGSWLESSIEAEDMASALSRVVELMGPDMGEFTEGVRVTIRVRS